MRTQVGIIGAGPAGLLLARILQRNGIESVILEQRSRSYVLGRIRAGVLEQGTVDLLRAHGVSQRLDIEGIPHETMQLRWQGERHDVGLVDENGRRLTTYGQNKIVEDLITQREADGLPLLFEANVQALDGIENSPTIVFTRDGREERLECDFIAGCDGFWGISRGYLPGSAEKSFQKDFPFGWLGILAEAEVIDKTRGFAHHPDGLAVSSARGPNITRLYLQKPLGFDPDSMTDEQIWAELEHRLDDGTGEVINRGRIVDKSFAPLRAFVCETMQHGRLAIADDAAHIVPPSGAKGLNLAAGDVNLLSKAILALLQKRDSSLLEQYSENCLRRVWPTVHWSCLMTEALHIFPGQTEFDTKRQYQTLHFWCETELGQKRFRNAMLGLPHDF